MMLPAILIMTMAVVAQDAPTETPPTAPAASAPASPGASQSAIEAGLADFKKRRFAKAQTEFQQAVDADSSSAAAYFYLGYTVYKIAEPKHPFHPDKQKAAALFAKAYDLDPAFQPVWGSR
jgi:tetratricopeptide (TPR) repeat protein